MSPDLRELQNRKKILVLGNTGAGKTTIARSLHKALQLPLYHVDSVQFLARMQVRPHAETIAQIREWQNQNEWIIDGYGPLDILFERMRLADTILFIDLPVRTHLWRIAKRAFISIFKPRKELSAGCADWRLSQIKKTYAHFWQVHKKMRPEMLRILGTQEYKTKTIFLN